MTRARCAAWLAGLWAGLLWAIALVGAPAAFAVATSEMAGRIAGRMFAQEAYLALALSMVLALLLRSRARAAAAAGTGSVLSADMLLALGALLCTVAGYFALQPMFAAARAGQGSWSFATLHGVSMSLYGLKALLVSVLAWRLAPQ
ncbi:DUF4149 domain-containing protein [Piscinibacter sp. XHJ-5]|uniref:DUF4149 domain-containing protein n=1 Tax=Piscinibacter sp. XHJ-5 TaxID=3037797 RepID=UPI0024532C3A|nr:DUF4149 domain-containing protein [Piscinibacter sp. XHJ-5]